MCIKNEQYLSQYIQQNNVTVTADELLKISEKLSKEPTNNESIKRDAELDNDSFKEEVNIKVEVLDFDTDQMENDADSDYFRDDDSPEVVESDTVDSGKKSKEKVNIVRF